MAGVLLGSDRTGGAVPAAVPERGAAGGAAGVAGRVPGSGGADRRPHDRAHRSFADRAGVDVAACARGAGMTEQATVGQAGVLARILDCANRANPYPLYAELRKTPVFRAPNGAYVVSTYREIWALMHDPRIGVDAAVTGHVVDARPLGDLRGPGLRGPRRRPTDRHPCRMRTSTPVGASSASPRCTP